MNENQPVTRLELIDAIAKLHVINDSSFHCYFHPFSISPRGLNVTVVLNQVKLLTLASFHPLLGHLTKLSKHQILRNKLENAGVN
jgi:hypothetical protein